MTVSPAFTAFINTFLACFGSCLGCDARPSDAPPINDDDHLSKQLNSQGQVVESHSLSEDFWGSSTGDLDYAFGVSQRSISSLSTSNLSFCSDPVSASTNSHNEFVNHGRLLWNQTRLQWIGGTKSSTEDQRIKEYATSLLSSKERFRRPIPLSEMVDFLGEKWELEGLYD